MSELFIGKFKDRDQVTNNYYKHNSAVKDGVVESHFNGLTVGAYVFPICEGKADKLFKVSTIDKVGNGVHVKFEVIITYSQPLNLVADIICYKYFAPDIVLLNKSSKSTKNVGFHKILREDNCPPMNELEKMDKLDFTTNNRKYFVCLKEYVEKNSSFNQHDIAVIIDSLDSEKIVDIVEQSETPTPQKRHDSFWNLYQNKVKSGNTYTLKELLMHSEVQYDNAPKKNKYLKDLRESLTDDGVFPVDNPMFLYDNVIVGRKQSTSTARSASTESEINEDDSSEITQYDKYANLLNFNPNLILYGPPGTGKTYGAMKIIEAYEKSINNDISFKTVLSEGRAKFITFHQAFAYEEFVEGIRPKVDENGVIQYPVEKGVLSEIAEKCKVDTSKEVIQNEYLKNTDANNRVWKVSLGRRMLDETVYQSLKKKEQIALGFSEKVDLTELEDSEIDKLDGHSMLKMFYSKIQMGDIVFIFNSNRTIRLIGVVTSDYMYENDGTGYPHRRSVKWIRDCENEPIDIFEMNNRKILTLSTIYELNISVPNALSLLEKPKTSLVKQKPYYLIIDEINRGNIAKIFGELITLIEKDKREELSCTLPYSKSSFTLPKNLYIIGTMNTTDRSIALLDTALRRRFVFVEIIPDANLVANLNPTIGGKVSPGELMEALNEKITKKLDRDHRIGHSYFMGDNNKVEDLYNIWYYKVIPLLMEYFYNDTKEVIDIIGEDFFDNKSGNIRYLSVIKIDIISDFEKSLLKIYKDGTNS